MNHQAQITATCWADMTLAAKSSAITELVFRGLTAKQMGMALSASRSMVLSHARRHNIRLANAPTCRRKVVQTVVRHKMRVHPPVPASTWASHREPIGLLELTDKTCCWPVGEAEGARQLFCGDRTHKRGHCERHWLMRGEGLRRARPPGRHPVTLEEPSS